MASELTEGHFYRKQIRCKSRIIAFSHRARFDTAARLVGSGAGKRLLDYGCGDGTFVSMAAPRFGEATGVDIAADQIQDCKNRLRLIKNAKFRVVDELKDGRCDGAYDVITCMETLEHCTDSVVGVVLKDLSRLCAPDGVIIISVPIETGPAFLIKYGARKLAAWRGLSDYRYYERYTLGNALRMILATSDTEIPRPVYGHPDAPYHSHYGFNWRRLRKMVAQHCTVEATCFSPINRVNGLISSQAWFICRPTRSVN